jgi:hypothetical protein
MAFGINRLGHNFSRDFERSDGWNRFFDRSSTCGSTSPDRYCSDNDSGYASYKSDSPDSRDSYTPSTNRAKVQQKQQARHSTERRINTNGRIQKIKSIDRSRISQHPSTSLNGAYPKKYFTKQCLERNLTTHAIERKQERLCNSEDVYKTVNYAPIHIGKNGNIIQYGRFEKSLETVNAKGNSKVFAVVRSGPASPIIITVIHKENPLNILNKGHTIEDFSLPPDWP